MTDRYSELRTADRETAYGGFRPSTVRIDGVINGGQPGASANETDPIGYDESSPALAITAWHYNDRPAGIQGSDSIDPLLDRREIARSSLPVCFTNSGRREATHVIVVKSIGYSGLDARTPIAKMEVLVLVA